MHCMKGGRIWSHVRGGANITPLPTNKEKNTTYLKHHHKPVFTAKIPVPVFNWKNNPAPLWSFYSLQIAICNFPQLQGVLYYVKDTTYTSDTYLAVYLQKHFVCAKFCTRDLYIYIDRV